jgi:hypothetical protein
MQTKKIDNGDLGRASISVCFEGDSEEYKRWIVFLKMLEMKEEVVNHIVVSTA